MAATSILCTSSNRTSVQVLYDDGLWYLGTVKHYFSDSDVFSVRYALVILSDSYSVMCLSARMDSIV